MLIVLFAVVGTLVLLYLIEGPEFLIQSWVAIAAALGFTVVLLFVFSCNQDKGWFKRLSMWLEGHDDPS